jgi:hypothetical protein
MESVYYLYRHIRKDTGKPFYIGVGTEPKTNTRLYSTLYARAFSTRQRGRHWENIYKKCGRDVEIMYETCCKEEIIEKEKEFISLYGLSFEGGLLCNYARGGQGIGGRYMSKETKRKIGEAQRGGKNRAAIKVVNVKTGECYNSIIEAFYTTEGFSYAHFKKMLKGTRTNKTDFIYGPPKKEN